MIQEIVFATRDGVRWSRSELIEFCRRAEARFRDRCGGIGYQPKGVFHSEMLLVCAVADELGVDRIIESGRARGQSALALARFFPAASGIEIVTVEKRRFTRDAWVAERRLADEPHVTTLYRKAEVAIPELARKRRCVVLIDGPKGQEALSLAARLLDMSTVEAIFVHDLHRAAPERAILHDAFPVTFATDDEEYVDRFRNLDDECWQVLRRHPDYGTAWGPYLRKGERIGSYASTLALLSAGDAAGEVSDRYRRALSSLPDSAGPSAFGRLRSYIRRTREILATPYWAFRIWAWSASTKWREELL